VLVISPTPTDPPNQGNSVRIGRICELLQYQGYIVHFLYYGLEGLNPQQANTMRRRWDYFYYVAVEHSKSQTGVIGHNIDDFYGNELGNAISCLQKIWLFDIAIVNYVWMSASLEAIHPSTYRLIDTHDVFGGRQDALQMQGLAPTWFYCSEEEERKGLDRADGIIAIQSEEAEVLSGRTRKPIHIVGHVIPSNFLPPRRVSAGPIRVGYMASDNPSNRLSLQALLDAAGDSKGILNGFEFIVGGLLSNRVPSGVSGFRRLGYIRESRNFYSMIDIVINPNVSGTGLKIKSVEALSYGKPLVSTADGMCGISTTEPAHLCKTVNDLISTLARLNDRNAANLLGAASREVFSSYQAAQVASFRRMLRDRVNDDSTVMAF
jgi:glycosyltransferase involved in cell wall biosynthesis